MPNKRLLIITLITALLLLIPYIAMQFTEEVTWTLFDFIIAGALLFSTGMLCELAIRKIIKPKNRIVACAIILLVLLLIWIELAVGII